ncbi:hypothetical protein [Rhizobacter sp. P5_C2]
MNIKKLIVMAMLALVLAIGTQGQQQRVIGQRKDANAGAQCDLHSRCAPWSF